jgi:uncharacterized protein (DUF1800 family)
MPAWNAKNIAHLLSRSLFGYSKNDFSAAQGYASFADLLDQAILKDSPLPAAPNTWVTTVPAASQTSSGETGTWYREFNYWWFDQMHKESLNMREKMVLFLHNHFANERDKVVYPQNMYAQNALFRKYAFGNFKQLVKEISIDPSMLIYLDGNNSRGSVPNENYGRELLELFTMGIGNYTETDVKQAAKVLSGWQVSGLTATFVASRWYTEASVTVLGKTAKFDVNSLIDHIFTQKATAEFICRKLYKEFVYYKPNEAFVLQMAAVLRSNNYEIKPLLKFLFTSDEFYTAAYIGSKIKNPTELMVGASKLLELPSPDYINMYEMSKVLQMQLFQPPDVAGWPGQREWISSTTYSYRGGFSDSLITGKRYNGVAVTGKLFALSYAQSFTNSEKAVEFVDDVCLLFLAFPATIKKKAFLLETLLAGTIVKNYSTYSPGANVNLQQFFKAVMRLPEFQLC